MPDNTRQYTDSEVQAMIKAYEKQSLPPEWFLDSKLNELIFAECLRSEYPMFCIYNPLTEAESYKILTDALSRKPAVPAEPVAENVVSLTAFRDKRSAVPKLSSSVPKFSRA